MVTARCDLCGAYFNPREMAEFSPGGRYNAYSGICVTCTKDAAEVAIAEASKTGKGGSPSEGIAAAEGKIRKASKDRVSKDKTREDASEEETTEGTDEEAAARGDNDGIDGEDVQTAPAGSGVPLLLGGAALLSVGGLAPFGRGMWGSLNSDLDREHLRYRKVLTRVSGIKVAII